ncbi:MAG: hypothetical protein IJ327_05195 [Lachnospiraceae bacterium]|nr:hypothetical protein [Lachnospiraceae bacterium]
MKKYISLICVLMCIMVTACGKDATFNGSKVKNENNLQMEYTVFNTTEQHEFELEAENRVIVDFEGEGGKVSLTIQKDGEDYIYAGNKMQTGSFSVGVPEAGIYTVIVEGENAKGSIHVYVEKAEE